jgi:hypothetical protein
MHRAASSRAPDVRRLWAALRDRVAAALGDGEDEPAGPHLAWFPCGPEILPLAGLMWFPDLVAVQPEPPPADDRRRPLAGRLTRR